MVYYTFTEGQKSFSKNNVLGIALCGDTPKRVFRRVPGIPNPWIVQEYLGYRGGWGPVCYLERVKGKLKLKPKGRVQ